MHEWNTRHKAITLLCTVISCFLEFFFLMFFFPSSVGDKYGLNAVSLIRASPVTLSVTSAQAQLQQIWLLRVSGEGQSLKHFRFFSGRFLHVNALIKTGRISW